MRLKYFAIGLSIATALGLAYTWQQTGIIQLAYQQNSKNKAYKELLDRNRYLRYNLINLTSASYLGNKLFDEGSRFEIPKESQTRILSKPRQEAAYTSREGGRAQSGNKNKILVTAFQRIQDAWPIAAIDSYFNKHAQAQDTKNKLARPNEGGLAGANKETAPKDFYQFYSR